MKENGFRLAKKRSRRYPAEIISYIALLANSSAQAETLLHCLVRVADNADKTEYMSFNQRGDISTPKGCPLKLVDKFTYLGSSVSSTDNDVSMRLAKEWIAIDRLSVIWKSDLSDKIKRNFFPAAIVSVLLYGCTAWTLTKRIEKKLGGNYTRMQRAILNKSMRQHSTKQLLYGHQLPITKTIQDRRTWHRGHCWRIKGKLISDLLQWTPLHGRATVGRPARTYLQQLCADSGCSLEDLQGAMDDRDGWRERVRKIRASSATWGWGCASACAYIYRHIYIYTHI